MNVQGSLYKIRQMRSLILPVSCYSFTGLGERLELPSTLCGGGEAV